MLVTLIRIVSAIPFCAVLCTSAMQAIGGNEGGVSMVFSADNSTGGQRTFMTSHDCRKFFQCASVMRTLAKQALIPIKIDVLPRRSGHFEENNLQC